MCYTHCYTLQLLVQDDIRKNVLCLELGHTFRWADSNGAYNLVCTSYTYSTSILRGYTDVRCATTEKRMVETEVIETDNGC